MANTFVWHNDPNSTFDGSAAKFTGTPGVPGSDSLTYTPFYAKNTSDHLLSDVGFFIPFAWARVDNPDGSLNHYESLTWDNSQNGFLDSNFNHTGEALLLTPNIVTYPEDTPDGHVAAGTVADLTDTHVFGPNSASVQIGLPASLLRPETIQPKDLLPFADLGSFAPGESKTFDITWTAHWGGEDLGAVRVGGFGVTLAPDQPGQTAATGSIIKLGNGNDTVTAGANSTITLGNGNDIIHPGFSNTITVGTGQDSFVFDQTTPGSIGATTITHFDPNKDVITLSNKFAASLSYHDDSHGNAVITVDSAGDTITLVGVHSSALHASDFHFA